MDERTDMDQKNNKEQTKRKILLMGSEKSGKTSIFSLIFTHINPIETTLFDSTESISLNKISFLLLERKYSNLTFLFFHFI